MCPYISLYLLYIYNSYYCFANIKRGATEHKPPRQSPQSLMIKVASKARLVNYECYVRRKTLHSYYKVYYVPSLTQHKIGMNISRFVLQTKCKSTINNMSNYW